ncbi:DNA ligase [Serratia phage Muldoon]|uniref:DNA ligase n=1 Tax=Serratia phage Muldoon TaxID=2601678 RepID=A0A5P8PHL1_9CAUD|nr:ATP-dependent DNA ligase [Serratia phage Muldoon]QFR56154.1 DNA ligase [Serratia phage Muldoon]
MILEIIQSLASHGSSKKKEAILKANENNLVLKRIFRMINDKQLNFGIRKFPEVQSLGYADIETVLDFMEFELGPRKITGNAAIEAFAKITSTLSEDDIQVIKKVLVKDLDCGVGRSTPAKVWKDIIQDQPQFLAESYSEKAVAAVPMPAYAQLKADGARCIAEVRDGVVTLMSRAGNQYLLLPEVEESVLQITSNLRGDWVVDGELIFYPGLVKREPAGLEAFMDQDETESELVASRTEGNGLATKSLKGTITPEEASGMVLQAWDLIPLDVTYDKTKKLKSDTYEKRFDLLSKMISGISGQHVQLIPSFVVNTLDEAKEIYFKYLYEGYEGIILKNMNGLWANARTGDQVKFKNEIVLECKIVDTYVHRKDPNKLGGIVVETEDGRVRVRVGSGFKDTTTRKNKAGEKEIIPMNERHEYDRERLWSIREILIGQIAQIKCNMPIRNESNTEQGSLFLPVFQLIRSDKDKANTFEEAFGFSWEDFLNGQVVAMPQVPNTMEQQFV